MNSTNVALEREMLTFFLQSRERWQLLMVLLLLSLCLLKSTINITLFFFAQK